MNFKARLNNVYFYLGLIGVVFSTLHVDLNTLTDLQSIINVFTHLSPVAWLSLVFAILGVFVDPSSKGIKDKPISDGIDYLEKYINADDTIDKE